ncbi:hypothetical protein [Luteolibacter luteus]|jgi:hypothetical protein|uniref:CBM-cenC domain-containing protein n=1 Tax=Luteolibacter luteus TaxID=2728835 RepID=A0A858RNX1_9BACT|nr:hypothetical protein [Luteolibacter luteus]QJE98118.1 hypothetical protein HHL09_20795 [Luteolibacter luteus]
MKTTRWILCLLLTLPAAAGPLLKNPGFDKELKPWTCDEGKVIPDPEKKDNSLLEVTLDGGVFGLSQPIEWPADWKKLTVSFRIKASQATEKSPVQWRLRIYDKAENSALVAAAKITRSGEWITVKQEIERPESNPESIMLESNRGEGTLWIDDVELK